jgi:hypothetical protein
MRKLTITSSLQWADNGCTTHFGGTYEIDGADYYYRGSDNETTPADVVLTTLVEDCDVKGFDDGEGEMYYNLNDILYENRTFIILIDEDDYITCIEPI